LTVLSSLLSLKVTFSGTLTSATTRKGVGGQTVTFSDGTLITCSSSTNTSGVATCSVSVLDAVLLLLSPSYSVSYAGGADYDATRTTGESKLL
jgi:hypothetical protein